MDDLISSGLDYKKLYPLLDKIFSICERRNIKLNPDKFHIGRRVEFGGSIIEYVPSENRIEISPSEAKVDELIGKDSPSTKKQLQSIIGSLNQLSQWVPRIKCHIPGMRKMTGLNTKVQWNPELEEEFRTMKGFLKNR